jgi:hypothetical protein
LWQLLCADAGAAGASPAAVARALHACAAQLAPLHLPGWEDAVAGPEEAWTPGAEAEASLAALAAAVRV